MTLGSWHSLLPQAHNAGTGAQEALGTRITAMAECLDSTCSALTITANMGRVAMPPSML